MLYPDTNIEMQIHNHLDNHLSSHGSIYQVTRVTLRRRVHAALVSADLDMTEEAHGTSCCCTWCCVATDLLNT